MLMELGVANEELLGSFMGYMVTHYVRKSYLRRPDLKRRCAGRASPTSRIGLD
jgi:hypothetical protein